VRGFPDISLIWQIGGETEPLHRGQELDEHAPAEARPDRNHSFRIVRRPGSSWAAHEILVPIVRHLEAWNSERLVLPPQCGRRGTRDSWAPRRPPRQAGLYRVWGI